MPQHLCHAIGCNVRVHPTRLMCPPHWFMVPAALRRKVWQEYRPGQCDDKRPSQAWLDAAREAINHVAVREDQLPLPDNAEVVKTLEAMIAKEKGK